MTNFFVFPSNGVIINLAHIVCIDRPGESWCVVMVGGTTLNVTMVEDAEALSDAINKHIASGLR